jgi:hypothetical protein
MADEGIIKPYEIERVCKSKLDVDQLTFKAVDTTESVYTRTLIQLQGASLPAGIFVPTRTRQEPTGAARMTARRIRGGEWEPPERPERPEPPEPPEPEPGGPQSPPEAGGEEQPSILPWDLFAMLKYRQDWKSTGYGIGELLFTTSLMPDEELVLEMKTWETSRVQQDREDTTDQRNVSDVKSTTSNATEAATENQTKTHEYVDAKASYSGYGASASVEGGWSQDVSDLQRNMEKTAQENSEQTTSEQRSTQKVRVAISRESGSESKTTRRIRNINQAHTLNANYYEVLREYAITLTPYEASLVLLGAEPNLAEWTGYLTWDEEPRPISLGLLMRLSQSAGWVQEFIDIYGLSPIKLVRERWSAPLYDAAQVRLEWWDDGGVLIRPEDREDFQRTVLRYVRPTPGWVEPDEKAALRWGYEVMPDREKDLLTYLYEFLPYSPQQILARAVAARMQPVPAVSAMTARFARAVVPPYNRFVTGADARARTLLAAETTHLELEETKKLLISGPFRDKEVVDEEKWRKFAAEWTQTHVIDQLVNLRKNLDKPTRTWTTTLPTQGVYADLALGICSGAEDYLEITRQFDLELKRIEIRRLELEAEKLRLETDALGQGKPQVSVVTDADTTSVSLEFAMPESPTNVEVKKPGA